MGKLSALKRQLLRLSHNKAKLPIVQGVKIHVKFYYPKIHVEFILIICSYASAMDLFKRRSDISDRVDLPIPPLPSVVSKISGTIHHLVLSCIYRRMIMMSWRRR